VSILKALKPRTENIEVERDLRGLGHTTLVKELPPKEFLIIKNSEESKVKKVAELLQLECEKLDEDESSYVLSSHNRKLSYKHHTVSLFMASLLISEKSPNSILVLTEKQILREELQKSLDDETQKIPTLQEELNKEENSQSGLHVHPSAQLYLQQAGILSHQTENYLHLNHDQVKQTHEKITLNRVKNKNSKRAV
jgi:hypothetical protein